MNTLLISGLSTDELFDIILIELEENKYNNQEMILSELKHNQHIFHTHI